MNFGDRQAMLKLAQKRFAEAKATEQMALLTAPASTWVTFLLLRDPK
jgi:hypothetical protein